MEELVDICVLAASDSESEERDRARHDIEVFWRGSPNSLLALLIQNTSEKTLKFETLRFLVGFLRQFDSYCRENYENVHDQISEDDKMTFRQQLIRLLEEEKDYIMMKKYAKLVGPLGADILNNGEAYPELMSFIFRSSISDDSKLASQALIILAILFEHSIQSILLYQTEIQVIYKKNLLQESPDVKIYAIGGMCVLLTNVSRHQRSSFQESIPILLKSIQELLADPKSPKKKVLEFLSTAIEAAGRMFLAYLNELYACVSSICSGSDDVDIRLFATEWITTIIQNHSKVFQEDEKHLEIVRKTILLIFQIPRVASEELTEEFLNPESGMDEEKACDDFGMALGRQIERIAENINVENAQILVLQEIFRISENEADWRVLYGAYMSLSQILEIQWSNETIHTIVALVKKVLDNSSHPKIRFASYHIIGQISDDQKGSFQQQHSDVILPLLIAGLDEEVLRLRSHALAAIVNFMDSIDKKMAAQFCPKLIPKVIKLVQPGNRSILIENGVQVLATCADSAKDNFNVYFDQIMPTLIQILDAYKNPEQAKLQGIIIECISFFISAVGQQKSAPFIQKVIENLIEIQDNEIMNNNFELMKHVLKAWHRICPVIDQHIQPHIERIVPWIMNIVGEQPDINEEAGCYELNELQTAQLDCLGSLAGARGTGFEIYIKTVTDKLLEVDQSVFKEVRISRANLMKQIVKWAKHTEMQNEEMTNLVSGFMNKLWNNISGEISVGESALEDLMEAAKEMIQIAGISFLSDFEILVQCRNVKDTYQYLQNYRNYMLMNQDSDDEEETETEWLKQEDKQMVSMAEFVGAIMKLHPEKVSQICTFMHSEVITVGDKCWIDNKFSLFLIADIIELVGPEAIPNEWPDFWNLVRAESKSSNSNIRQVCSYIIGLVAKMSSTEFFTTISSECCDAVQSALSSEISNDWEDEQLLHAQYAKDNAVSSFHRIIKHQQANVDVPLVVSQILPHLPLLHDIEEAKDCHDWFSEFCKQNPDIMQQYEAKIVEIFTRVWRTPNLSENSKEKVRDLLKGYDQSGKISEEVIKSLDANQILSLKSILE